MKYFIIVFLLSAFASAQTTLQGSLKDQTTGEPVPFAAVYTRAGQGTTSSVEGTFRLTVPRLTDTVWVRCLGYRTELFVAGKARQPLVIQLVPAAVTTEEVVIVPPRATDILREVSRRQFQNAPDSSYTFDLWFREYLREENVSLMFCEGQSEAMRLPQVGFFHTFSQLNRGRLRPRGESHLDLVNMLLKDIEADTVIESGQGGYILDDLDFFTEQPRWMNPSHFDHYHYELQTDVVFRGRAAYHIIITPRDKDLGRAPRNELWVDAQSFALMSYFAGVDLSQQTGSSDQLIDGLEGSWKAKAAIWVLLRGLSYQARAYQKRVDYHLTDRGGESKNLAGFLAVTSLYAILVPPSVATCHSAPAYTPAIQSWDRAPQSNVQSFIFLPFSDPVLTFLMKHNVKTIVAGFSLLFILSAVQT